MLGCKFGFNGFMGVRCGELIDTCWDVNFIDDMLKCRQNIELIDTCWDVN